jgi:hypothetical protein
LARPANVLAEDRIVLKLDATKFHHAKLEGCPHTATAFLDNLGFYLLLKNLAPKRRGRRQVETI